MIIFNDLGENYPLIKPLIPDILRAYAMLVNCFEKGGKLLICGNGGSACDAQHIAGELMKSFAKKRSLSKEEKQKLLSSGDDGSLGESLELGLPVIVLSALEGLISAYNNDADAQSVYAQQVYCYAKKEDLLLAISCSGNSTNIAKAIIAAKAKGIKTIALTGNNGGLIKNMVDCSIIAPKTKTFEVQEIHLPIYHALCLALEEYFFGGME